MVYCVSLVFVSFGFLFDFSFGLASGQVSAAAHEFTCYLFIIVGLIDAKDVGNTNDLASRVISVAFLPILTR